MEKPSYYLSVKSLSKITTRSLTNEEVLLRVMQHNLREILAEFDVGVESKIDRSRIGLNQSLFSLGDSAKTIAANGYQQIITSVKKVAKNASLGIECVFSLPSGLEINYEQYFQDATNWMPQYFGIPLLSSIIHNDEGSPHCHVVLLSIKDGKLSTSKLLDSKENIRALQTQFYSSVAINYGLAPHKSKKERAKGNRASSGTEQTYNRLIFETIVERYSIDAEIARALIDGDKLKALRLLGVSTPTGTFQKFIDELSTDRKISFKSRSVDRNTGVFGSADSADISPKKWNEKESPITVYRGFNSDQSFVEQVGEIWRDQSTASNNNFELNSLIEEPA